MLQVIAIEPEHVPFVEATETSVTSEGSESVTTTLCEVSPFLFVTVSVYVSNAPTETGSGLSVFVIFRSVSGGPLGGGGGGAASVVGVHVAALPSWGNVPRPA